MHRMHELAALYKKHPGCARAFVQHEQQGLERCLSWQQDFSTAGLDLLYTSKHLHKQRLLASAIVHLPPDAVLSTLGKDALLWGWFAFDGDCTLPYKERDVLRCADVHVHAWRKAANSWHFISGIQKNYSSLLATYALLDRAHSTNVPLQQRLIAAAKKPFPIEQYSLTWLTTEHDAALGYADFNDKEYNIYLDAPFALTLCKKQPVALAGLMAYSKNVLFIRQLQGLNKLRYDDFGGADRVEHNWALEPFDWRCALVTCVQDVAASLGFSQIGILSAHNNKWVPHQLPFERALKNYDATAKRLHFRQRRDGNWYKKMG
ncbi:MAG: hypothetical protein V1725_04365 [archaeon]